MRLPIQIEIIIFRKKGRKIEYLLLKRTPERGGFWQPISGGLRDTETIMECIKRESREEIGISDFKTMVENVHFYQFDEFNTYRKEMRVWITEFVFGAEVDCNAVVDISKNHCKEHEEYKWCNVKEALSLLKWENNKIGLTKLNNLVNKKNIK